MCNKENILYIQRRTKMIEKSKSELVIVKGQEFKISVKEHIKKEDIFLAQYKQAADMLETIIKESKKDDAEQPWQKTEYENNIIAFCGERGEGKSSAMLTFINAIYHKNDVKNNDEIDLFENCTCTKNSYIAEPIVIDPSQFDDVHNVLDIVLAKMYKKFDEKYGENNQTINEYETQDLLDQFQKVYRQVAMISNQEKLLDDEFDYEGNIGKLAKLGESTNLKKDFGKLIASYLIYMSGVKEVNHSFVIAIDDLDLRNSAAYKLAEQIRKYLIIPHVAVIMAVKVDQLELAIQEKNVNEYKGLMQYSGKTDNMQIGNMLDREIKNMAERYVSKLIPKARRIYMSKNQTFENLKIVYKENENGKIVWNSENGTDTLAQSILKLIYAKTGMIFLPEESGVSYLVPDNLRDLINWITELVNLTNIETDKEGDPNGDKKKNIEEFYQFFKWDWMNRELPYGWEKKFSILESMDVIHTNTNAKEIIIQLFEQNEVDQILK